MAEVRNVGRPTITFDQATTSNVIIHINRYMETVESEVAVILRLCSEVEKAEGLESRTADIVKSTLPAIVEGSNTVLNASRAITNILNDQIRVMEENESTSAASADAAGLAESARKMYKKQ